jgi:serine/threonine-protein kinase
MHDDARIGATLAGKYCITRLLGRGAFGAVYEATNIELEKRVAVKLIEPEHVRHAEVVARFRGEARAASRVESEHIVQVFDVGNDEQHGLYMVMELLQGEDLATRLDREFKLSPAVAVHVAAQAARGLAKAHAAGVVHRDLKPPNIFLLTREDGSLFVKLVDFGISKMLGVVEPQADRALTRVGTVVGTPNYMSPEQAQAQPVDGRTDVWALGAVLYEMLAGAPAFPHDAPYEATLIAIAVGPEPRLADAAPWVPPQLAAVVDRALTRDLSARIADCATFAALLAEAMPNATRPRREESLYMEPSDSSSGSASGVPRPDDAIESLDSIESIAARRAPTTIAVTRDAEPPRDKGHRAIFLFGLGVAAATGAVFAWQSGLVRQCLAPAPSAVASVVPLEPSASTASSASASGKPSKPTPLLHPRPKPKPASSKPAVSHS